MFFRNIFHHPLLIAITNNFIDFTGIFNLIDNTTFTLPGKERLNIHHIFISQAIKTVLLPAESQQYNTETTIIDF